MTDPGGPQRHTLCFLSTLLSQKVPEKSDAVLRCMIAGQPKPDVTWYKNGQAIDKDGLASSYEFFEHQYIHLLYLPCCTQSDAAVYQVSARSCEGMICCSASIEVECLPENPQVSSDPRDGRGMSGKHETKMCEEESANQTEEKADSSPNKFNLSCSPQVLANHGTSVSNSENPLDVKATRQRAEACDSNNTQEKSFNSGNTTEKQDAWHHRTMHTTGLGLTGSGDLGNDGSDDKGFTGSHQNPKAQKYISFSLPLSAATVCAYPSDCDSVNTQPGPQVFSEDSDSDYELCPEITLTYTEEFSDDDLEYLECSDVMTDYSNAVWQRSLQGTDQVFLLESDDEEVEFNECGLGGCEHFLSEMGCGPRVSGDIGPVDTTTGFSGYHSQLQEVGVRRSSASRHISSPLHARMTLTLGPHQDGTATVTEQGRCPFPTVSEAPENDCSGIQVEIRDCSEAGEEFASDNLLTMDKAVTEAEVKPLSEGLDKLEVMQGSESVTGERSEEKRPGSRRGTARPNRAKRPRMKEDVKKQLLKERAPEGTLDPLPKEPAKHPLTRSHPRETPHIKAGAWTSHLQAEQNIPLPAEQDSKTLPPQEDLLSKEGDTSFEGEGMLVNNLFETSQVPDQTDHLQMQIQKAFRERSSLSHMPAFSVSAGEESSFPGTTMNFVSILSKINKENVPLAQYLGLESCTQGPQQEDSQNREDDVPSGLWAELAHELSALETNYEEMSPVPLSVHLPQDARVYYGEPEALSAAFLEPTDPSLTLENVCSGSRGRETTCVMDCFEAGDRETCYETMDPPFGAPVDKYFPQEICPMDFELTEGQSKVCDLYSPDKILAVLQTEGSKLPQSICECGKSGNSSESPLFTNAFTWNMSQEASKGAVGATLDDVENSLSILSSMEQAGLEEAQPPTSKDNSFVNFNEGDYERPKISAPAATDIPASCNSDMRLPEEQSTTTLTANVECHQVTREIEDTSIGAVATKVHQTKYYPVSVSENNLIDGADKTSLEILDENNFQFSSSLQSGHILSGSTSESTKELPYLAPSIPGAHGHTLPLPEGEDLRRNSPLQIDNQPGDKSQIVDRADSRSFEEDFQEKGSEMKQTIQPQSPSYQSSLSANDFQEILPPISAMLEEANVESLECSLADSGEERGCDSNLRTSVSVMAKTTMEEDSQSLNSVPSLSEMLLWQSDDSGLGSWEAGNKVKIITLEASGFEIWPPKQVTDSEYKEAEAGLTVPGRAWALSDILKADVAMLKPDALGAQNEATVLADHRETCEGDTPASDAHWSSLSSQCLRQPRLLESSVDPVDKKELDVIDYLPENSKTGGKESVKTRSQEQEENQLKVHHSAFTNQFVNIANILESSVDPIDGRGKMEYAWSEKPKPSDSTREGNKFTDGNLDQRVEVQPAVLQVPRPQDITIRKEKTINQDQVDREGTEVEQGQYNGAKMEGQPAIWQALCRSKGVQRIPSVCCMSQDGSNRSPGEAKQRKRGKAEVVFTSPLPSCLAGMTGASVDDSNSTGHIHGRSEPRNHQDVVPELKERGTIENEYEKHVSSSSHLTQSPCASFPEGNVTHFSLSHDIEELKTEELQIAETKPLSSSDSPTMTLAFISGECESEKVPEGLLLQDLCQKRSTLDSGKKSRKEMPRHVATQTGNFPGVQSAVTESEGIKKKQETSGSGHLAEGVKKKILSRVAALRLRLEEKENVRKNPSPLKKVPKFEKSLSRADEKKDPKKAPCKREGKAPVLLKKIQAEMSPDHSGNVKLSCQFAEIHEDSTIWWTKDSKSIAQVQRSAGDNSSVSLAIARAGQKDQGLYDCCIKNSYGKATTEFNLTAAVLKELSSHMDSRGCEEIEFSQLIFKEDFFNDSYFGDRLRGQISTEELHFGEGVHRKAFRSTVMRGLMPVFQPGHACVLKVHNAIAHGTRNNDELVQKNYRLAAQECYVQNTARYYAKIYAAEAQPLEGFGEVPEIIPIFLIHRPENNIPYATVEEELIGEFVKYSIRDGKEINFLRRESEAGQKCCTFQHWVYQKTSGCLLVTDMQGVGMKLTDVGIATLGKGYKGFKGNCSMTFIDQFKALHQCNKYCKMLGLKSLQNNSQKPKKPGIGKGRVQANPTPVKTLESGIPAEKK
uniref:Alpha-protein kinase 2 n=1 Tax=Nannospalax galili TaxID=1026970 RepID=A0A8C6W8U6_NANGA